ncbi:hypothetical protein FEM48_Zijuj02G0069200 [Ziziphus jujuba var. spinosa]|uniref:Uncharacterized protein n=1 Tax=Ziziphus jujuba var. spinosa TaxID=714518 RepID=A0A978VUA3_ZIZJJ|nr:hypothetical protein FEM48_Zijuj02G0069200 [Ziziphus jujuba var. spinosa]
MKKFQVSGSICDLVSLADREELINKVLSLFNGKLHIVINNVGTNITKPTLDFTAEDFSFLMKTNLESAYHMCQLANPLLKASGAGSVVFVCFISGVVSINIGSIYSATKGNVSVCSLIMLQN